MVTIKDYVIIAIVCLFTIAAVVGIAVVGVNSAESQNDILEETEIMEEVEVTEETIPEPTVAAKPMVEIPEPNIVEATEPEEEEETVPAPTEPPVKETKPKPTEPPVKETEPKPTEPEPTEPPVVETEPTEPPVEETEPATEATEPAPEATEPPVEEETSPAVNSEELEMLACVIYQEAGGDAICDECRYRVADVVLNRVADSRYPDTMYKVLTQRSQYGRFHWTGIVWPSRAANEPHAVERAYNVAADVLSGNHSELYGNGYIYQAEFVQGRDNIYCCGHYFGR